ncbi:MAG TPA: hypothetical protein P5513_06280 [Candidatus Diapherotrites archaeon]|nr:hypothetical protein [Candidatus Diapherotrites archaeon]
MIIKTFFDNKTGAVQMKFDVHEERIYISVAKPFANPTTKSKFDWKNSLVFTLSADNHLTFLAEVKQVLDGKIKSTSVLSYNTPNAKKAMAFGERQTVYSLVISQNKDKIVVDITKPNAIQFYKYIQTFFQNTLLVGLIVDALSSTQSTHKSTGSQPTTVQENETDVVESSDDNVLESLFNVPSETTSEGADTDNMF